MDIVTEKVIEPAQEFVHDSYRLLQKCSKPEAKEFQKIAIATTVGFFIMGFIGFVIKLLFIPINQLLVA